MRIILIGPSGSGKGTLANYISSDFEIPHISTGDLFRRNIMLKTELGQEAENLVNKGLWVPDELTIKMLMERISEDDAKSGFVLEGCPRTLNQAMILDAHMEIDLVLQLDVDDEILVDRLSGRWVCAACNKNHNVKLGPATQCVSCRGPLYQREDDKEEYIRSRLAQYRSSSADIINFYNKKGILYKITVEADERPREVYKKVGEHFFKKGILPKCSS